MKACEHDPSSFAIAVEVRGSRRPLARPTLAKSAIPFSSFSGFARSGCRQNLPPQPLSRGLEDLGNLVEAQVSCVSTWLGCQYVAHLCTERHAFPVVNHAQKNQKYVG